MAFEILAAQARNRADHELGAAGNRGHNARDINRHSVRGGNDGRRRDGDNSPRENQLRRAGLRRRVSSPGTALDGNSE